MTDRPERIWADRGPKGGWMYRPQPMTDSQHEYTADLIAPKPQEAPHV